MPPKVREEGAVEWTRRQAADDMRMKKLDLEARRRNRK